MFKTFSKLEAENHGGMGYLLWKKKMMSSINLQIHLNSLH